MTLGGNTVLAIGLPEAGKTTYLAALWYTAESEEIPGSLLLQHLSDESKHLNDIKDDWLKCKHLRRTNLNSEQITSLSFSDPQLGKVGDVVFPDLSGETFRNQWKDRSWSQSFDQLVKASSGLILFIHPDQIKEPFTVAYARKLEQAIDPAAAEREIEEAKIFVIREERDEYGEDESDQPTPSGKTGEELSAWDATKAASQVQLVELLQFLAERIPAPHPKRLAVVISAWDCVGTEFDSLGEKRAEGWLSKRVPLLHQYLVCNGDSFVTRFYGVSAQGGNFDDAADRKRLRAFVAPSERTKIFGPDCLEHDITEPVRWVLGFRE